MRVTLTTICGTDVHILKGEYPVRPAWSSGMKSVGVIHEIGPGVTGYKVGERVLVGAITPCGQCNYCLGGNLSQCGGAIGGWKFGNTINGAQAEYVLVPHAQANLAKIPDELSDDQVILLADIASTGFSASESADVQLGDSVAIFAQGPIGLCATAGAKLKGAGMIITVESDPIRTAMSRRMGADVVLNQKEQDVVATIKRADSGAGRGHRYRSAGHATDLRELPAGASCRRHGFKSRRLLRQALRSRSNRLQRGSAITHRHYALPWRQGAHAPPDRDRAAWPCGFAAFADAHVRAGTSPRLTNSLPTGGTAY